MRIRNIKNKNEILAKCPILVDNADNYKGLWHQIFKNENPIHIEIGMGKGKFITEMALNNPNINFIGIEKFDSIMVRATEKIDKELPNLRFIKMDAVNINEVFEKEISLIYLNFSDPWPKKRHAKRRLADKSFLEKYDQIFKSSKIIKMKTDNNLLFASSIVSLSEYGYIIKEVNLDLINSDIPNIMTEYETKFSNKGQNIKYLMAIKPN